MTNSHLNQEKIS